MLNLHLEIEKHELCNSYKSDSRLNIQCKLALEDDERNMENRYGREVRKLLDVMQAQVSRNCTYKQLTLGQAYAAEMMLNRLAIINRKDF